MQRRNFILNASTLFATGSLLSGTNSYAAIHGREFLRKGKLAKNIIFLVSDGMSNGTLTMAGKLLYRKEGRQSQWIKLYADNQITRGLMDTASASSLVTDSAAASSSWGGGVRVKNGYLNVGPNGEEYKPILQKFKAAGKSVGCVTTVPITHATPAGFCVNSKSRGEMSEIALKYLPLGFDVMMGGGLEYFSATKRKDKQDVFTSFRQKGYQVAETKSQMLAAASGPLLGVFSESGLPFSLDQQSDAALLLAIPTLADMTSCAINRMKTNKSGFVLQVEGGKVDWAVHANDVGALLYDQLAFDEAIKVAIDFAKDRDDTMVIITTDHGNSNPGLLYGDKADINFDKIQHFKQTNDWILHNVSKGESAATFIERVNNAQGITLKNEEAKLLLDAYEHAGEEGVYNPYKLPFEKFAIMQRPHLSIVWAGMDHTSDCVELCAYGIGKELINPFILNTDMHQIMLQATGLLEIKK